LDAVLPEKRGPLHGVAIGVKDVIFTRDMPTQMFSPIYKDDHPEVDAEAVLVLRSLGALIFGKTHTTEFATSVELSVTRNHPRMLICLCPDVREVHLLAILTMSHVPLEEVPLVLARSWETSRCPWLWEPKPAVAPFVRRLTTVSLL